MGCLRAMKTFFWFLLAVCALAITGCGATPQAASSTAAPSDPTSTPSDPGSSTGSSQSPSGAPAGATKLANIQASSGWESWGQLAPGYADCDAPCTGVNWTMTQGVASPSMSGNAAEFQIGGTTPYSDVLWTNPVIGQFSTQGLPDTNHTLLPTIHNFIYDLDFYVTDASVTQVLEFDVNMFMDSVAMTWAHQCNHLGDGDWDINVNLGWTSTGVPCNLTSGWNHVTIQVQREDDNSLLFQSITLNGTTANINKTLQPYTEPASWYGITVNYQMDGNYDEASNTTYVDNMSLTYW
jgi:hypothetical protein